MNIILDNKYRFKNFVSVDEKTARNAECPINMIDSDIFIAGAPKPPEGMIKPRFIAPDNWEQVVADAKAQDVEPVLWEETAPQAELDDIALKKARRELTAVADEYVNSVAREHRYKGIHAVGIYQQRPSKFQAEANALADFNASVWEHMEQLEQDVLAGARDIPTAEELMAELPKYTGP